MVQINKQAGANVDVFSALPLGAPFALVSPRASANPWRVRWRYVKIGPEHVKDVASGREMPLACTEGSGAAVVLVPEGEQPAEYDVNFAIGRK